MRTPSSPSLELHDPSPTPYHPEVELLPEVAKTFGAKYPVPRLDSEERKGLVSFCPLVVTIGNTKNPSQGDTPDHLRTARGDPTILKTETGTPEVTGHRL